MWKLLLPVTIVLILFKLMSCSTDFLMSINDKASMLKNISSAFSGNPVANKSKERSPPTSSTTTASINTISILETENRTKYTCAKHEKYEECPEKLCQPQLCDNVGIPMCLTFNGLKSPYKQNKNPSENVSSDECQGSSACICIENYVRNEYGVCRPVEECSSCGGDRNATVGCGTNCGRRCSNYNKKNVSCTEDCYENSCDCKDKYVFDDYTGKCVYPEDCTRENHADGNEGGSKNGKTENSNEISCNICNICDESEEFNNEKFGDRDNECDINLCSNEVSYEDIHENDSSEESCGCDTKENDTESNENWEYMGTTLEKTATEKQKVTTNDNEITRDIKNSSNKPVLTTTISDKDQIDKTTKGWTAQEEQPTSTTKQTWSTIGYTGKE